MCAFALYYKQRRDSDGNQSYHPRHRHELQLSRSTVSKAINNTGVLADATREKILRKAAEMGYKQFAYLPLFQPESAAAPADAPTNAPAEAEAQPGGKREIAMMTTCFLSNSHFSSMMLDRFSPRSTTCTTA